MNQRASAFLGLGSNMDKPLQQIETALQQLRQHPELELTQVSSRYRSAPLGPQDQDDYINAVVSVSTRLTPQQLLHAMQVLENAHGRVRNRHWGPRTLDIDLLSYDQLQLQTVELVLPHPQIAQRNFVLIPWIEIAGGDFSLPGLGCLDELLSRCPPNDLQRVAA